MLWQVQVAGEVGREETTWVLFEMGMPRTVAPYLGRLLGKCCWGTYGIGLEFLRFVGVLAIMGMTRLSKETRDWPRRI